MAKRLPVIHSGPLLQTATLLGWNEAWKKFEIELDTQPWFAWLAQEQSFRFTFFQAGGPVKFTVRPEKRGPRTYWQAWKTIGGQTTKKYIAPSAKLTKAKLDATGEWFYQQLKAKRETDPTMLLYASVVDLIWLAERLIEHCRQPALVQQAQRELTRIKGNVGH
jgi:hypothetical protein